MNKSLPAIAFLIILAIFVGAYLYKSKPAVAEPTSKELPYDQFKTEFMNSCIGSNATAKYCSCAYDHIVNNYGVSALIDAGNNMDNQHSKDLLTEAVRACLPQY